MSLLCSVSLTIHTNVSTSNVNAHHAVKKTALNCVCCYDVARESGNWKYSHGREKVEIYEVGQKEP